MSENLETKLRRFAALAADILFVGGLGALAGILFRPSLIVLGPKAYFVGFAISLMYHGLTNAWLAAGQSPGKIIFGIKVVLNSGERIGLARSLLRSFPVVFLFFGKPALESHAWLEVFYHLLTPFLVALVCLAVFSPCCRSMHDIVFQTYVVKADSAEVTNCRLSRKTLTAIVAISAVLLTLNFVSPLLLPKPDLEIVEAMKAAHADVMALPNVVDASVQIEGGEITVQIQTKGSQSEAPGLARKAACALVQNFHLTESDQSIHSVVAQGFDMKIYRSWLVCYENTLSAKEWLARCVSDAAEITK